MSLFLSSVTSRDNVIIAVALFLICGHILVKFFVENLTKVGTEAKAEVQNFAIGWDCRREDGCVKTDNWN